MCHLVSVEFEFREGLFSKANKVIPSRFFEISICRYAIEAELFMGVMPLNLCYPFSCAGNGVIILDSFQN